MAADGIGQGFQQGGGFADPVGQGGAVEIEPLAVEDLALALKRKVVGPWGGARTNGASPLDC